MYVYIFIHVYINLFICVHIYVYVCVYICMERVCERDNTLHFLKHSTLLLHWLHMINRACFINTLATNLQHIIATH